LRKVLNRRENKISGMGGTTQHSETGFR